MIHKFTVNNNDPYFGAVTLSNPEDSRKGCCTTAPTFTYACTGCNELKSEIRALKNKLAIDSIESTRIGDHLRSQLATAKKELSQVKTMHAAQAQTIIEKNKQLLEANGANYEVLRSRKDQFGRTFPEYHELVKQQDSTLRRLDAELVATTKALAEIKERNLDPEPHKLKAAILTMQKQIDELTAALAKEKNDHNEDNGKWASWYDCGISKKKETQRLQEENHIKQQKIEDQNRKIGSKQEEINTLKLALNKAKEKQTFEVKPAVEIRREYEDKIRRLIDVTNSQAEIIYGLQTTISSLTR